MATPAAAQATLSALRRDIARIEGTLAERLEETAAPDGAPGGLLRRRHGRGVAEKVATGVEAFDAELGGGLPSSGLLELHAAAGRDAGAASGFALALARLLARDAASPLLWIGASDVFRETGRPYAPGLAQRFGVAADGLLVAEAEKLADLLWIAEAAAGLGRFRAVLLEVAGSPRRLDLTATRRLHRRALAAGRPLLLIRAAGVAQPTAAPLRLIVSGAPAGPRSLLSGPLAGSIGPPAFSVTVSKSPAARTSAFTLEWSHDAFRERGRSLTEDLGALVPLPADGAAATAAVRTVLAFPQAEGSPDAGAQPPGGQRPARRRA